MMVFLSTFWQNGLPFALSMGFIYSIFHGWERGLAYGAFGGFVYGLFMASFVYLKSRKYMQDRPLSAGEKLIEEGPANYHRKAGWFYLTDSRLFYVSDKLSIADPELSFPLSEIVSAERGFSSRIIPNKLILNLSDGTREEFVIQTPKSWLNHIKRASNLLIEAPRNLEIHD